MGTSPVNQQLTLYCGKKTYVTPRFRWKKPICHGSTLEKTACDTRFMVDGSPSPFYKLSGHLAHPPTMLRFLSSTDDIQPDDQQPSIMQAHKLAILQNMPIFGGVSDDVLDILVSRSQTATVKKGSFFFREGDQADALYILEKGKVIVVKNWQGCAYELGSLSRGDCFGEMALIDMSRRSASVKAAENCQGMKLTPEHLYELYKTHLSQYAIIQMNIAREISRRLREADQRLFLTKVAQQSNGEAEKYYTFQSI